MGSLRFKLPALFLAGIVAAALVTALLAVRLFQDRTRDDTLAELRRQAAALADLYANQALRAAGEGRPAPEFAAPRLERATGTKLYYAGLELFPGRPSGLRRLPYSVVPDAPALEEGHAQTFEFVPPGENRTYLAAAHPLRLGAETFGAIVTAKPRAELRAQWLDLARRLGLAFLAGLAVAAGLVWYLSRRLTAPVLALTRATDELTKGRYDVELPPARKRDEISRLTTSFGQMTQRLADAEEMERNFLMSVSHELRTPLTAIRGHADALSEGLAADPEARQASLEVIRAESERLSRLVGDLLDLAKLDAHRFALAEDEVDLRRLVERAFNARTEEARRRGIAYERTLSGDPVVHTDGDRVLQIVTNLIDNAFTWTPDGGRIALGLSASNGTVSVSVSDSGPGISEPDQDRIFRPFFTGDGAGGTGLGLAIARELAHALGGDLELASRPGEGSRFELRLPVR
ncbi:MAG: HAMP domain-containing histidine kinase [Thermoleophilia bacterium]|nr:HAMP domain-containing histidine kinase [Thermoleophilia bacterium]